MKFARIKALFVLAGIALSYTTAASADSNQQVRQIIALQKTQLSKLENELDKISTKTGEWKSAGSIIVDTNGKWVGPRSKFTGPKGAEGPQGCYGPQGNRGVRGPQGPAGVEGPQGCMGLPGADGAQGLQGPSGFPGADCHCGVL